jgi:hypothetical protein
MTIAPFDAVARGSFDRIRHATFEIGTPAAFDSI